MTTKKPTVKMERAPAVVLDATPKEKDPTLCACVGVERGWDVDGLVEPGWYRCSVCGKKYQ